MLTIAIAKGRLQGEALDLLSRARIRISPADLASRKLTVEDERRQYRIIFVKPADVPVYVEHGIADCGIVGRDVVIESNANLLLPLDLKIARCKMIVATTGAELMNGGMLRVATKYPRIAATHFGERGIPVEIIPLVGSVELAPVLGLADCIVDLMETGRTLRENGLRVVAEVLDSSGRLVVNRAAYQLKTEAIADLVSLLSEAAEEASSKR
ncbi:MAG TPA: ATP phosphoribosyltransferase [Pyrinomonadaceae bacterium]|jgi:ATP phosphoribosyltransferase|nr:ATP phosphoribosyltransferase [Pyrinomonadaceae bacterium]